jgi:3-oxoacyl-[acyl-carrier-protein] synthase-3
VLEKQGLSGDDVDLLFPHQANIRIIESVAERAGMPMDKVFVNIHKYGNTSAASIPIALAEAVDKGRLRDGMLVVMVAFGAGFTWGAALVRW